MRRRAILLLPAALLVVGGIVLPLCVLVRVSFYAVSDRSVGYYRAGSVSLDTWQRALHDPYLADLWVFSLWFGGVVAVIAVLLGLVLALGIATLPPRWRSAAVACVLLPKFANTLVILYGLELLLGRRGPVVGGVSALSLGSVAVGSVNLLHNLAGAVIAEVYLVLPYAALLLIAARLQIPADYALAARGLGAGRMGVLGRVILPLMIPAVLAAFGLSFVFGFGALTGPALLGGPEQFTLAIDIQRQSFENQNWPGAAVEAVLMMGSLVPVGLLLAVGVRVIRRLGADARGMGR